MKVQEQVFFLERSTVHVAVGTPARVLKLCDLGSLSLDKTKVIFWGAPRILAARYSDEVAIRIPLARAKGNPLTDSIVFPSLFVRFSCSQVVFFDKAVDVKMRNLFTMKDVQKDLWTFYETHMESLLKKGQIEVSLL